MLFEICLLVGGELLGLRGQIVDRVRGVVAGDLKYRIVGQIMENGLPASDGLVQRLERLAEIGLALAVFVQIGGQLVDQGGEGLEFAVDAPVAGRFAAWDEPLDGVGAFIDVLGVEVDAGCRIDAGFGDGLLLCVGEGLGLVALCRAAGGSDRNEQNGEPYADSAWFSPRRASIERPAIGRRGHAAQSPGTRQSTAGRPAAWLHPARR